MSSIELERRKTSNFSVGGIFKSIFRMRETSIILIIFVVAGLLSIFKPVFLSQSNMRTTGIGLAADGIVAVGMTVALVLGAMDLSVGSVMSFATVTAGALYLAGVNIWLATLLAIIVGTGCGLFNGFMIGKVGLNPFVTTLGMMSLGRGASYVLTQGSPLSLGGLPKSFLFLGGGNVAGIPMLVIIFVVIAVTGDLMMRKSESLRKVFYIGSNEKASMLSGINVSKVKIGVFTLTAFLASIAGILTLSRFHVATPTGGTGAEMRAISAAVIGGTSLAGGEGTVLGAILGVMLINIINSGLVLLNVSVYWQELVMGSILLIAVTIDLFGHKKKVKKVRPQKV